jgi:hypothetical protein
VNLKTIQKQYDKLTDPERFRLALAAELRGDFEEARKLNEAARMTTYRMRAYPYAGMRDALLTCGMMAALELLQVGTMLSWAWGIYYARARWDAEREAETYRHMVETSEAILARWDALPLFAADVGLDLDQLLYMLPARSQIDMTVSMAQGVKDIEERTLQAVIDRQPEAERDAIRKERMANLAENRHTAARTFADELLKLWEFETQ